METVIDNLFAFPDNLHVADDGNIWIGTPSFRDSILTFVDGSTKFRRMIINARMPLWLFIGLANMKYAGGFKLNPETGKIMAYLYGNTDRIDFVTAVSERGGKVFFSSLKHDLVGVVNSSVLELESSKTKKD